MIHAIIEACVRNKVLVILLTAVNEEDKVVEAIDGCVAAGMPTSVITHINRLNHHGLPELRDFLAEHGVASWQLQPGNPSGVMSEHHEMVIQPEDLLWLVPQIAQHGACERAGPRVDTTVLSEHRTAGR